MSLNRAAQTNWRQKRRSCHDGDQSNISALFALQLGVGLWLRCHRGRSATVRLPLCTRGGAGRGRRSPAQRGWGRWPGRGGAGDGDRARGAAFPELHARGAQGSAEGDRLQLPRATEVPSRRKSAIHVWKTAGRPSQLPLCPAPRFPSLLPSVRFYSVYVSGYCISPSHLL